MVYLDVGMGTFHSLARMDYLVDGGDLLPRRHHPGSSLSAQCEHPTRKPNVAAAVGLELYHRAPSPGHVRSSFADRVGI